MIDRSAISEVIEAITHNAMMELALRTAQCMPTNLIEHPLDYCYVRLYVTKTVPVERTLLEIDHHRSLGVTTN